MQNKILKRPSQRLYNQLRTISLEKGISPYAEGSCLAKFGNTHVMCTASIDTKLPPWLRNSGKGWIEKLPEVNHQEELMKFKD